jgi:hypothetical protein
MSEGVDLSQIRGDWKFHMDYLQNAIERTLERQQKYWAELGDHPEIDACIKEQKALWADLRANANDKGTISTTDGMMEEFINACRESKPLCDAWQDDNDGGTAEEFAEACRQARALCDDLEMMKDQRPAEH